MKRTAVAVFLSGGLLLPLVSSAVPEKDGLQVRVFDDRGKPLRSAVEFCYKRKAESYQCLQVDGTSGAVTVPKQVLSIRVEGENYGPFDVSPLELRISDRELLLRVPRKARLQVQGPEQDRDAPLVLSLYAAQDSVLRTPVLEETVAPSNRPWVVKIPSGDYILVISRADQAPQVEVIHPGPGEELQVISRAIGDGWSAVVRVLESDTLLPVSDATLTIRQPGPNDSPNEKPAVKGTRTDRMGLVALNGISNSLVHLVVRHPSFLTTDVAGLTSRRGTVALTEIFLKHGGELRATLTISGEPARAYNCRIRRRERGLQGSSPPTAIRVSTDDNGVCVAKRLQEGLYILEAVDPDGTAVSDLPVRVYEEALSEVDFALQPIQVLGRVFKDEDPAPQTRIELLQFSHYFGDVGTLVSPRGEVVTDDEGRFSTTVWTPGAYKFLIRENGTPGAPYSAVLERPREEITITIRSTGLQGMVIDERGNPVANAAVTLELSENGGDFVAQADEEGAFSFPFAETGEAELTGHARGYESSLPMRVTLGPDLPPPAINLTVRKLRSIHGVLLADGSPVSGAMIASVVQTSSGPTITDENGEFEVPASKGPLTRVLASGRDCPLSDFDVVNPEGEHPEKTVLTCMTGPSSILLRILDPENRPLQNIPVLLIRNGRPIPFWFLNSHQSRLGVAAVTDGSGRLSLVNLPFGHYQVYLMYGSSEEEVSAGSEETLVGSVTLGAYDSQEIIVTATTG